MTHHESKRCSTVGDLVAYLSKYPPIMPLMTADGEDVRATRLSNKGGEAVELREWSSESSPLEDGE